MPWSMPCSKQSDRIKFGWDSFWSHLLRHILTGGQSFSAVSLCFSGELVGLQFSLLLLIKRKMFSSRVPLGLIFSTFSFKWSQFLWGGEWNSPFLWTASFPGQNLWATPLSAGWGSSLWSFGFVSYSSVLPVLWVSWHKEDGALVSGLAIPGVKTLIPWAQWKGESPLPFSHTHQNLAASLESEGLRKAGGLPFG